MDRAQPAPHGDAVVVFARLPVPGQVKTRLAAAVGNEAATMFYKHCAEHVIAELGRLLGTTVYLFYSRGEDEAAVAAWLAPLGVAGMVLAPQLQHPDLGARMQHAMAHAFSQGHRRVAVVGTDVPDLTAPLVSRALEALGTHQAVFGPAEDGGYYLLALAAPPPSTLFQGIEWSTPSVLAANVASAQQLGLQVAPLDTLDRLPDIDTVQDLQRWSASHGRQQQEQQKSEKDCSTGHQSSSDRLLEVALRVAALGPALGAPHAC